MELLYKRDFPSLSDELDAYFNGKKEIVEFCGKKCRVEKINKYSDKTFCHAVTDDIRNSFLDNSSGGNCYDNAPYKGRDKMPNTPESWLTERELTMGEKKIKFFSLGFPRESKDVNGDFCYIYDLILHEESFWPEYLKQEIYITSVKIPCKSKHGFECVVEYGRLNVYSNGFFYITFGKVKDILNTKKLSVSVNCYDFLRKSLEEQYGDLMW